MYLVKALLVRKWSELIACGSEELYFSNKLVGPLCKKCELGHLVPLFERHLAYCFVKGTWPIVFFSHLGYIFLVLDFKSKLLLSHLPEGSF